MKNSIKYILLSVFISLLSNFFIIGFVKADQDLLKQYFDQSLQNEEIIDLGNNKNAVGNNVFFEGQDVEVNVNRCVNEDGENIKLKGLFHKKKRCKQKGGERKPLVISGKRDPLLVRITKTFLRIIIALSISMILFVGLKYIIESSKGENPTESRNHLVFIGVGLLIALGSLTIINLISSVGKSSLKEIPNQRQTIENNNTDKPDDDDDDTNPDDSPPNTNNNGTFKCKLIGTNNNLKVYKANKVQGNIKITIKNTSSSKITLRKNETLKFDCTDFGTQTIKLDQEINLENEENHSLTINNIDNLAK